jgi:HAE1 family hydrophobic/amphiphilic exporter-1
MSRLSELAVSKRSVTLLLAVALFFSGISAWGNLKQELLPDIEFPVITIIAPYPGAGAADVAEQVAKPIERAISGVARLERLQSTSANSIALVVAQFEFDTDVKETRAQIEQNLANVGLPDGVNPTVNALNINASPVIVASIRAETEDGLAEAARIARTVIVPELLGLEGVSAADVTGGLEQRVMVTLDPDKLAENGVSTGQISGVLAANNLTFPSGQLPADGEKIPVSTIGSLDSIEEIRNLVVGYRMPAGPPADPAQPPAPTPIAIGDLGTVELVGVASTGYARTNGNPALTLTVTKTTTANTVEVAEAVEAKLAEISAANDDLIDIEIVSDLSVFITESRDGLLKEGGLGAVFAILTIFLFLASLRSTVVAAVSIPLSILTALVVMQITGITINVMTLGGLAVAVGRVVDDAIVVLENIYRHRAMGEDRMTAVIRGPREVATAITAATVTTVGVFLPLGYVGGLVSEFFLPFALTVTFALLASLVVALTVVPVLAYLLIDRVPRNVDEHGEPRNSLWVRAYAPTIRFALSRKRIQWGILAISAVMFAGSLVIAPLLPTQFINAGSEKLLQVTVAPPPGTSTEAVLARAEEAEAILEADDKVLLVQTSVPGEGDTSFQTIVSAQSGRPANSATLTIRLADDVDLNEQATRLSGILAPVKRDGFDVAVAQTAGFTSNSLNVVVAAEDPAAVEAVSDLLLDALAGNPDLLNLKSDLSRATPEVQVIVDPNEAIGVGLTAAQVAGEVRSALVGTTATRVQLADQPAPVAVVLRLDPERVTSVDDLETLPVGTVAKRPLGEIAEVRRVDAQGSITRIDQSPAATLTAEITSPDTGAVSGVVQAEINRLRDAGEIPAGVDVRLAGVTQQQREAFSGLFFSMGVAVLLVYVAMVLTFNSLITPFVILFSLPLATIGAFPALLITDRPIGVSALIGFLMLIGIVVTNAIVLLDLVERLRREGMNTRDALIEGGKTRVRPILMTAIATILALMPLAAGLNEGSIIAAELGTVVIGGLFSSTFLTLIVVPVVYSLVDGGRTWRSRRRAARQAVAEEAARAAAESGAPPAPAASAGG